MYIPSVRQDGNFSGGWHPTLMELRHVEKIAEELSLKTGQVQAVAELLDDGATVPFIARYRKEATGELDEVAITSIRDRLAQLEELDKRRESILQSLEERELLTDELKESILAAETLSKLEDIYLPFRPKRRTRATIAMEKGLEPLAEMIFQQDASLDPAAEASAFVDEEKDVESADDALAGARDIIAEWVNQDQDARAKIRMLFEQKGMIRSRVIMNKEEEGAKFRDYFEWEEPAASAPSHRVLAIRRGENEGFLTMRIAPPEEDALALLEEMFVKGESPAAEQVRDAVTDSLQAPALFVHGNRNAADDQGQGRPGGHPGVWRQLAGTAAGRAPGPENHTGHRPGLSHRLQGRLPGPAGWAEAYRPLSTRSARTSKSRNPPRRSWPWSRRTILKPLPWATARPGAKPRRLSTD